MLYLYILLIIASYFLGAMPFMIMIGRMRGVDLSREPDLHHALWYKVGRPWGILGFLLDILKGVVPVLAGFLLGFPLVVNAPAGLAALCGQMWPVFRKFDGERGNTVSVGINFTLSLAYGVPIIFIIALAIAMAGFFIRTALRWKASGSNLDERLRLGGSPSLVFPLAVIIGFASCPVSSARPAARHDPGVHGRGRADNGAPPDGRADGRPARQQATVGRCRQQAALRQERKIRNNHVIHARSAPLSCHCEERSDEAISSCNTFESTDCFAIARNDRLRGAPLYHVIARSAATKQSHPVTSSNPQIASLSLAMTLYEDCPSSYI